MWLIDFGDEARRARFVQLALARGVLFKRGAYNFASVAHDEDAIAQLETAASEALVHLREEEQSDDR
jgi:glutamate-1-semialdehyde aminotransferase